MTRLLFIAALLAVAFGAVFFYRSASVSSRTGGDVPVYSAYRYDPYGTAALRDLLLERGISVRTLETPNLRSSDRGVLIQTQPIPKRSAIEHTLLAQRLIEWIGDGNTVIQLTRTPTDLMTRAKIAPTTAPTTASSDLSEAQKVQSFEQSGDPPRQTPARVVLARLESDSDEPHAQGLLLWSPMYFDKVENQSWKPLARTAGDKGKVAAGEVAIGRGRMVVVGAPTPALNGTIGEEANLAFLLAQIGDKPVILDEWSHGIGHEATIIGFIHEVGLIPLLIQVIFIAAIYVWSTSGYPRADAMQPVRRRSSVEQIHTLGFLYSRSFSPGTTFNYVSAEVMRRLSIVLHCPVAQVPQQIKQLKPQYQSRCEALLQKLNELRPAHGPRCQSCGYELYMLKSDRCPECGALISPQLHQQISDIAQAGAPGSTEAPHRKLDQAFARVLTLSHELIQEVQRDRSAL